MNSQALASELASEKASVRQILLSTRLALSEKERLNGDSQIFDRILCHPLFIQSTKIACYFSHLNEPHLIPSILNYLKSLTHRASPKLFYLPILQNLQKFPDTPPLLFGSFSDKTTYQLNHYKIPEPNVMAASLLTAQELDLILVPMLGFDSQKRRLGMGGGFYDRTLHFKIKHPKEKPYLLGIAYACQQLEHIPTHDHDVRLDAIITERSGQI